MLHISASEFSFNKAVNTPMVFSYLQQTDRTNAVNIGPFFLFRFSFFFFFFSLVCFPGHADLFGLDCFTFVFNVSLNVIVKACML